MIWLLLTGCLWAPARVLGPTEHQDVFALRAHGQVVAGPALVTHADGRTTLHALAPTGTELFEVRVEAGGASVRCPDPELARGLARIPFHRDLTALYALRCDTARCRADGWRLRSTPDGFTIAGSGGPATLRRVEDRWVLEDTRRGYTLTVSPGGAP